MSKRLKLDVISTKNSQLAYSSISMSSDSDINITDNNTSFAVMGRKRSAAFDTNPFDSEDENPTKNLVSKKIQKKRRRLLLIKPGPSFNDLPPHFLTSVISHLSLADQTEFRAVCRYAHDEIDAYWRMRQSISVNDILNWFPYLRYFDNWKFESLYSMRAELRAVFNLLKVGNLKVISFHGIKSVHWPTLVEIIEKGTCRKAIKTLQNVHEIDIRGCTLPLESFKHIEAQCPKLKTLIVNKNLYIAPCYIRFAYNIRSKHFETSHYKNLHDESHISSFSIAKVDPADEQIVWYLKRAFNNLQNIIIDRS